MPLPVVAGAIALKAARRLRRGKGTGIKKRRRRTRLSKSQLAELATIKAILGKTAAANALPFYLGR